MIGAEIMARLAARLAESHKHVRVAGAASLANLDTRAKAGTTVYVVAAGETLRRDAGATTGPARALVDVDVAVVIQHRSDRDGRGQKAMAEIEALRQAVFAALYGHQPDSAAAPLTFVEGALTEADGGQVWWQDIFNTERFIEEAA